jgi:type IV secretion system protein VirB1
MMPVDFQALAQQCAPLVEPTTLQAIVRTESGFNPYAIGVVGGRLARQPQNKAEAVATVQALEAGGWNFSLGLSQVNRTNLTRYGLDAAGAFDPCANLRAGSEILGQCYSRAAASMGAGQAALRAAFSCYYSGNFQRGFQRDARNTSYVERVVANATPEDTSAVRVQAIPVIANAHAVPATLSGTSSLTRSMPKSAVRAVPGGDPDAPSHSEPPHAAWDTFGDF